MKARFISLTAGMILGAVIFLISICLVGWMPTKSLGLSLTGLILMWGCGASLELFKTRHQLTTHTAIIKLLRS
ncbi:hypothetical protein D1831_02170 [Lactiplantibacillus garii]|uniref:Uncharacterized protein n=1 Tax=Lactiplantibacillus garii TaxID=2306423 RepID=A0A3R8LLP7_9LACO|nr:hypothetical protein [Lactiplantibacillus garii]RRK11518.1 hypothetical protein D1831_02170 [Lactiplantibacillus garii]